MVSAAPPLPPSPRPLRQQLMRRAGAVALAVLLAALALGLVRMDQDIDGEVDAAMALAAAMARLAGLAQASDGEALAVLHRLQAEHPPRHLLLRVHAADGRLLLAPPADPVPAAPLRWLLALHQRWLSAPDRRQVSWPLVRPDGRPGPCRSPLRTTANAARRWPTWPTCWC